MAYTAEAVYANEDVTLSLIEFKCIAIGFNGEQLKFMHYLRAIVWD
jgi:hypothetical protein